MALGDRIQGRPYEQIAPSGLRRRTPKITREINMSSLRVFVSHLYIRLKYLPLVPLLFNAMTLVPPSSAFASTLPSDINTGGYVLMIRHALAPGNGDPEGFELGNCSTQRNLNAVGKQQSQDIGQWLRGRGVVKPHMYSSQWCRCMDTARLMDQGPVIALPGLNSFYDRPQDREPNMQKLTKFLEARPRTGPLTILVTHYVTIAELVGMGTSSGEGVLLKLKDNGVTLVGRIPFDG